MVVCNRRAIEMLDLPAALMATRPSGGYGSGAAMDRRRVRPFAEPNIVATWADAADCSRLVPLCRAAANTTCRMDWSSRWAARRSPARMAGSSPARISPRADGPNSRSPSWRDTTL